MYQKKVPPEYLVLWMNSGKHNPEDRGCTFETSIRHYPTTRPKSHKTCFLNAKTDLQLWNPLSVVLFPRSNAASSPHYLNRIFRYSLPSPLSLVTEATRYLSALLASCLGGDTHAPQTSSYGRRYTAALSLGTYTVQTVQNTKYVIFFEVFFCLI